MLDKLDGFKKRRRRGTGGDDEEEEEGEGLSLTEYLERKEVEYNKRGKPKKKRVSQLLIIIITINIGGCNICGGHCCTHTCSNCESSIFLNCN